MKIIKKLAIVTFLVCMISTNLLINLGHAASYPYPTSEDQFKIYLENIGTPYKNRKGLPASWEIFRRYKLVVYTYNDEKYGYGDVSEKNNLCEPSYRTEYRYLGYDKNNEVVTNKCFRNDATSGNANIWKYEPISGASDSWDINVKQVAQKNYIKNTDLQGHGAKNLSLKDIANKQGLSLSQIENFARVDVAPTWKAEGSIFTQHYSGGTLWYATFTLPPMVPTTAVKATIATDANEYTIPSDSLDGTVKVKYRVIAKAPNSVPSDQIAEIAAGFSLNSVSNMDYPKDYKREYGLDEAEKPDTLTLSRANYKPRKDPYEITLYGGGIIKSVFKDTDSDYASKTIKLYVEPKGKDPSVETKVTVTPVSQEYKGKDVTVKVNVKGMLNNITDASKVKGWSFKLNEKGSSQSSIKSNSEKAITSSADFTMTIPKSRIDKGMTASEFTQYYIGKAEATLIDDSKPPGNTDEGSALVYKNIQPPPPPVKGVPPKAIIHGPSEVWWIDTPSYTSGSSDADGSIVSEEWTLDGQPTSMPLNFPHVTDDENHVLGLTVTDNDGLSDTATMDILVKSTKPKAEYFIYGFDKNNNKTYNMAKVNRKIEIDATPSTLASASSVIAPIDYTQTNYEIKPPAGVDPTDILIRQDSDKSKLNFLVRKPGDYEITTTVTNNLGEVSDPVVKTVSVIEDQKPVSKVVLSQKKVYRDGTQVATISATDNSVSPDFDTIQKRTWYIQYDEDNDGFFNDNSEPLKVISDTNQTNVTYNTKKVGNYRIMLKVKDQFAEPTLPEFIRDEHYLTDELDIASPMGKAKEIIDDSHFFLYQEEKAIEVDNVPPLVDFGMISQQLVDIFIDTGGLVEPTQQHLTGPAPGGGTYDHYYYNYDYTKSGSVNSLLSDLYVNLNAKGVNAKVTYQNNIEINNDYDGLCRRSVPEPYQVPVYKTVTANDALAVIGISSSGTYGIYQQHSDNSYTWTQTGESHLSYCVKDGVYSVSGSWSGDMSGGFSSWATANMNSCKASGAQGYGTITDYRYYTGTKQVIDHYDTYYNYVDYGCSYSESVNVTNFVPQYNSSTYRSASDKYFIRFDNNSWSWAGGSDTIFKNKTKNDNIHFWEEGPSSMKSSFTSLVNGNSSDSTYNTWNYNDRARKAKDIEDFFINKYSKRANGTNFTIILGDTINYTVNYTDNENDPEYNREWKYTHDETKINGRTISNQPSIIAEHDVWINNPIQLREVGTYKIQLRSRDNPINWNDNRFDNYRKWSDESMVREYTVNVHRRPIANFTYTVDKANSNALTLDPVSSFDPDHIFTRVDKGLIDYQWSYVLDGVKYNGKPPSNLVNNKTYDVTLQVEDVDGAFGSVTKSIKVGPGNDKPIAKFTVQKLVQVNTPLDFVDLSYDPNGDPLTNYQITVRAYGSSTILKTLSTFPSSIQSMGLSAGKYVIGLTVDDIPAVGPSLRSDLYEQTIDVKPNNIPPKSVFTLTPYPVEAGNYLTYTDASSDPDGDPLVSYSWKVEKLDSNGNVEKMWTTGSAPTDLAVFNGVGKYRVYQTVFDLPPSPLPSLSDTSMVEVDVIQGKKPPVAAFKYHPDNVYVGQDITLDPTPSYDYDGDVVKFAWTIKDPLGAVSTINTNVGPTEMFPKIKNPIAGDYEVQLHVFDNDGLRSLVPAVNVIPVKSLPANIPPVALFNWSPLVPFVGDEITFNPDASYDTDGTIVSYNWMIKDNTGATVTTSTQQYPKFIPLKPYYDVTLVVRDDRGATGTITRRVNVNIAKLTPLVTHTPEWQAQWVKDGYDKDVNMFWAGEKFIIIAKTTPAAYVWGSVNLGGKVGYIYIPKADFKLVTTSPTEYVWKAELWRDDFKSIPKGKYRFQLHGMHPIASPTVQSNGIYEIEIVGNIYQSLKYHRNY